MKDFNRLLKSPANSEGEAIVSIMENSSDEYEVSEISDSYKLKLGLMKCASPMSRDPNDIDDITNVSNKLIEISKIWSNIETYQEQLTIYYYYLIIIYYLLFIIYYLLFIIYYLLFIIYYLLFIIIIKLFIKKKKKNI